MLRTRAAIVGSCYVTIGCISTVYQTAIQVFESEAEFKQQAKFGIDRYVKDSWLSMAENRKSLSLLNMEACNGKVHPCWKSVGRTVIDVKRAIVKVRLLTDTYHLQSLRAKFNRSGTSSICPLCAAAPEDRLHFVTACTSLRQTRQPYLEALENKLLTSNSVASVSFLCYPTRVYCCSWLWIAPQVLSETSCPYLYQKVMK